MPAGTLTAVAEQAGQLKQVAQAFQAFQVARAAFINSLTGFLARKDPTNLTLEALMKNDVMAVLCCPLAQDPVPGIQSEALKCLASLSSADPLLSQVVVSCGVLDSIVLSLSHESGPVQAAADTVVSSVARSTVGFAERVLAAGVLQPLVSQLQSSPHSVKEAAVKALNSLIQSSQDHALAICDDNLLSTLVALMLSRDTPTSLCKSIVLTLANAAANSEKLAESVVRLKALEPIAAMAQGSNTPPDLKAAALNCLSHVARHNEDLARQVASSGVVDCAVGGVADRMLPSIRRNAAALLLELCQKTPRLAEEVSTSGAPSCVKQFMQLEKGSVEGCLQGCLIAGSMASYKPNIARAVVDAGAGAEVIACLSHASGDAGLCGVAAWSIEMIAQHGEETTMPLVAQGALQHLIEAYARTANPPSASGTLGAPTAGGTAASGASPAGAAGAGKKAGVAVGAPAAASPPGAKAAALAALNNSTAPASFASEPMMPQGASANLYVTTNMQELRAKIKSAIKAVIRGCNTTGPIEQFVADATPPEITKHLLRKLEPLLAAQPKARQQFVTSGALARMQNVMDVLAEKGRAYADSINKLFPPDVVNYYR